MSWVIDILKNFKVGLKTSYLIWEKPVRDVYQKDWNES